MYLLTEFSGMLTKKLTKIFEMKLKTLSIIAASSLVLASCLKSRDSLGVHGDKGSIVTEIYDVSYLGSDTKVISLEALPATETVDAISIRVYAPRENKPSGAVHVTLVQDAAAVTAAGLTAIPANAITLPPLEFDIPAGTTEFKVPITLNKNNLDLSKQYGIGFKITAVSQGVVSDLSNAIVVAIVIKNEYHADYHVTGYFFHPSAPRDIDMEKGLGTLGAKRCEAEVLGDLGGWKFAFDVSGTNTLTNWEARGSTPAAPASGFMSSDNPGAIDYSAAAPNNPGTPPWVHSTYNNTYNPTTKTFWMHYGYNGTSDAGRTRQIYEKWVRL